MTSLITLSASQYREFNSSSTKDEQKVLQKKEIYLDIFIK